MIPNELLVKIGVHGVPRSGTSWLGQILNSSPDVLYKFQPLFSYELKDFLNTHSSKEDIDGFFNLLRTTSSDFLDQVAAKNKGIAPDFVKNEISHLVYKEVRYHHLISHLLETHPGIKIIGIVRNPLSVLASWFSSPREFRRDLGWNEMEEWKFAPSKNEQRAEEFFGYDKWKEVALLFEHLAQKFANRFYLVNYAELLHNTYSETEKLFGFCGLKMTDQTNSFIEKSRSVEMADTYSVFKSKKQDDQWKEILPREIISAVLDDLDQSSLKKFLEL